MMTTQPDVEQTYDIADIAPNIDHIVTEDDTPVDNIFSEKQQRLLTESLYASWSGPGEERPFVAMANVGVFYALYKPPLVPDMFLSLDVHQPDDLWEKRHRSYFIWEYGKPPDVVIEVVSNTKGGELGRKLTEYAQMSVLYYVVFDPDQELRHGRLRGYELQRRSYSERSDLWFPEVGLGLMLWHGAYEGSTAEWLRWCDHDGVPILTGAERAEQAQQQAKQAQQQAEQAQQQAEQAQQQAEQAQQQAEQERSRAERLAAQLRAMGIEPQE